MSVPTKAINLLHNRSESSCVIAYTFFCIDSRMTNVVDCMRTNRIYNNKGIHAKFRNLRDDFLWKLLMNINGHCRGLHSAMIPFQHTHTQKTEEIQL